MSRYDHVPGSVARVMQAQTLASLYEDLARSDYERFARYGGEYLEAAGALQRAGERQAQHARDLYAITYDYPLEEHAATW